MRDNLVMLAGEIRSLDRRCYSIIHSPKAAPELIVNNWDNVVSENLLQPTKTKWDRVCNSGKTPTRQKVCCLPSLKSVIITFVAVIF